MADLAKCVAQIDEAHPAELILRPPRKEKTGEQRGAWHALLSEFGKALGHTPREMKQIVKEEYYGADVVTLPNGARYKVVQSSEDEDRAGYARLIDFTIQLAAEQGVHLEIKPKFH